MEKRTAGIVKGNKAKLGVPPHYETSTSTFLKPANKTTNLRPQGDPRIPKVAERMDHTFNPGGGPGQTSPPLEMPATPGQGPIFSFDGDGKGPNADSAMLFTRGARKRVRGARARLIQDQLDNLWHLNSTQSTQNWTTPSRKWHHNKRRLHGSQNSCKRPRTSTGHNGVSSP